MDIGMRIKSLRLEKSMTHRQLSDALGVSVVSISGWENGTRQPSASALISLANAFDVSVDYLLGVSVQENIAEHVLLDGREQKLLDNFRVLDRYGKQAVETLCEIERARIERSSAENDFVGIRKKKIPNRYIPKFRTPSAAGHSVPLENEDFEMLLVDDTVPQDADFAVQIQGNSMAPYINDGDTVYVKQDCKLSVGDVGIFSVDGAMYCKQYYTDASGNLTLLSANREMKEADVYVSSDSGSTVKCQGKVILKTKIPDLI